MERSALALEEAASEIEEDKKECTEETCEDEPKQEESDVEMSNKEAESTENVDCLEEASLETAKLEAKEEPCNTESSEIVQGDTGEKEKIEEITDKHSIDAENIEEASEASVVKEEEKSQTENIVLPFENIKIKEEPIDDIEEEPENSLFEFANVEVKEEPMDPDMGKYSYLKLLFTRIT